MKWTANSNFSYPDPILTWPWCILPWLTRLWGTSFSGLTVPSSAEEMLQNTRVQRLKCGNPINGLPSGRLVTLPKELNITLKPQWKVNLTPICGKKMVMRKLKKSKYNYIIYIIFAYLYYICIFDYNQISNLFFSRPKQVYKGLTRDGQW